MDGRQVTTIQFTLESPLVRERVQIRLRGGEDRWTAIATVDGASTTAIAPTARLALTASLAPLPDATVRALLADVALYGPSAELARLGIRSA